MNGKCQSTKLYMGHIPSATSVSRVSLVEIERLQLGIIASFGIDLGTTILWIWAFHTSWQKRRDADGRKKLMWRQLLGGKGRSSQSKYFYPTGRPLEAWEFWELCSTRCRAQRFHFSINSDICTYSWHVDFSITPMKSSGTASFPSHCGPTSRPSWLVPRLHNKTWQDLRWRVVSLACSNDCWHAL